MNARKVIMLFKRPVISTQVVTEKKRGNHELQQNIN